MSSLRARLFAYLAAAAVVAAGLTVVVAGALDRRAADRARRDALAGQADALVAVAGDLRGVRVLVGRGGAVRPLGPRARGRILARLPSPPRGQGEVPGPRRTLLWAGRSAGLGTLVVLRPAARQAGDPRALAGGLVVAGLVGALVAAALAGLLARRLTRPLEELTEGARRVAGGERAAVPVRGADELATLAAAFNTMSHDLTAARDAERRFLLSVSHELKTPLTAVRGYAEALADGAVPPPEAARTIGAESARLERLVADLLDLARLERTGFAVADEPVDLRAIAHEVAARFVPRARVAGVELRVDEDGDATAAGDPGRLVQVVSNLAENALRTVPRGGHVLLVPRPARFEVRDDGPGLAAEELPRAFDRFFLWERYRGERPVGTGLGLALVRELTEAMGGTVEAESAPRSGTTFRLHLRPAG